jgi:hypothetical protein
MSSGGTAGIQQDIAALKALGYSLSQTADALTRMGYSANQVKNAMSDLGPQFDQLKGAIGAVSSAVGIFSTALSLAHQTTNYMINTEYQWADLQLQVYQNTIAAIYANNNYAQALALQAMVVNKFGTGSVQAANAATAVQYVYWTKQAALADTAKAKADLFYAPAEAIANLASTAASAATQILQLVSAIGMLGVVSGVASGTAAAGGIAGAAGAGGLGAGLMAAAPTTLGVSALAAEIVTLPIWGPKLFSATEGAGQSVGNWIKSGGGVNIGINVSRDVDLTKMRQEIQNALSQSFLNMSKTRGVFG